MKTYSLSPMNANQMALAFRTLRWIAVDAAIGANCGAIFGLVFGAFGLLLAAESWSIVSVASYFAVCGAVAGAMVGACVAVLEGADVSERTRMSFGSTLQRITHVVATVNDSTSLNDQSTHRLPHNRLSVLDRRGQTARESMNPSRN